MANDRIMLRCSGCGGWKTLLKHFPGTGPTTRDNGILDWLDAHAQCHPNAACGDLGSNPGFTLHTEDAPELDPVYQNYVP